MWDCFHLQADKKYTSPQIQLNPHKFLFDLSVHSCHLARLWDTRFIIPTRTSASLGFSRTSWTHLFYQFLLKLWDCKEKCTNAGRRADTNSYAVICVSYLVHWLFSTSYFRPHHPCFAFTFMCECLSLWLCVCVKKFTESKSSGALSSADEKRKKKNETWTH